MATKNEADVGMARVGDVRVFAILVPARVEVSDDGTVHVVTDRDVLTSELTDEIEDVAADVDGAEVIPFFPEAA